VCDANILLSAILGRGRRPERMLRGGAQLLVCDIQLAEVAKVLARFPHTPDDMQEMIEDAITGIAVVDAARLQSTERIARARLHARGQPDWPVLAAALELDAAIWSDDRDFFGVGVPVWSTWALDRHPILTGTHDA
jgi:predicted nucleic acid-binding protein